MSKWLIVPSTVIGFMLGREYLAVYNAKKNQTRFDRQNSEQSSLYSVYRYTDEIVIQAFRDLGFEGKVQVNTFMMFTQSSMSASVISYIEDGQRCANVTINYGWVNNYPFSCDFAELYAVAGHEAAHVVKEHARKKALTEGLLWGAVLVYTATSKNRLNQILFPVLASYYINQGYLSLWQRA